MSENQNRNNLGEQIRDAVQGALDTGDFRQLNEMVAGTVNTALEEAKVQMKKAAGEVWSAAEDIKSSGKAIPEDWKEAGKAAAENLKSSMKAAAEDWRLTTDRGRHHGHHGSHSGQPRNVHVNNSESSAYLPAVKTKKVGDIAGTLYMVFGGIGTGIMALALAIECIMLYFMPFPQLMWQMIGTFVSMMAFILMIERGSVKKKRLKRANRYVRLSGNRMYIDIPDLAKQIGKSKRFAVKDVKKMLRLGIFPEGHLDSQETCLMLNDSIYQQYLTLEKERNIRESEEKEAQKASRKVREPKVQNVFQTSAGQTVGAEEGNVAGNGQDAGTELNSIMEKGQDFIHKLRDMNDEIEGEVISAKLFRLENLLKEIFDRVKAHREQMPKMEKFMDYYLPTTLKLVQAYRDFDKVSVPGENIQAAKAEIENTLDTINEAFGELLNNLYRDTVFDVTTDAQVLQSMLAREGLTREMEPEFVRR